MPTISCKFSRRSGILSFVRVQRATHPRPVNHPTFRDTATRQGEARREEMAAQGRGMPCHCGKTHPRCCPAALMCHMKYMAQRSRYTRGVCV